MSTISLDFNWWGMALSLCRRRLLAIVLADPVSRTDIKEYPVWITGFDDRQLCPPSHILA
jgi:hypothetical protein